MKKRERISVFLMVLTILVITGFQVYWLYNNYREEKRLFGIHTNILFRETIFRLQASKLKFDSKIQIHMPDKEGVVSMTNVLQDKMRDSSSRVGKEKSAMVIAINKTGHFFSKDSNIQYRVQSTGDGNTRVFDFLVGVDSLRDSIKVNEIADRYREALQREKITVPFKITTTDTLHPRTTGGLPDLEDNKVTVGFLKPITYRVDFVNNSWFLLRRMWPSLVISFLLVGVTIVSFLLLYRNLIQQRKLTQLKNDFISNITHELKTPIATVSVAIEAMKSFNALEDPLRTKQYLEISGNELQRLSLLVDKVLKLSMFEKQQVEVNKETFDLKQLVEEVVASMRLQFEKYEAQLTVETSGTHFELHADRLHITSVLYNLLDNALKYSKVKPSIQVTLQEKENQIEISVTDNGAGIPSEFKDRIFDKFFRVPSGDIHNVKGYGLGLSYVAYVVQRHNATINVESQYGIGSRFTIKFPVQ